MQFYQFQIYKRNSDTGPWHIHRGIVMLHFTDAEIYLCVTQSIYGDIETLMLNSIEKFKVTILHLNRAWNH